MTAVMTLESDEILRMDFDKRDFLFREDEQRSWADCMANDNNARESASR